MHEKGFTYREIGGFCVSNEIYYRHSTADDHNHEDVDKLYSQRKQFIEEKIWNS